MPSRLVQPPAMPPAAESNDDLYSRLRSPPTRPPKVEQVGTTTSYTPTMQPAPLPLDEQNFIPREPPTKAPKPMTYTKPKKSKTKTTIDSIPNDISISNTFKIQNKHRLHFTFDDGPNPETTPVLLKYLEENNIFATFFLVGVNIKDEKSKELLQQIQSKGHIIGSHTFEHMNMMEKSDKEILDSLSHVEEIIKSATGKRPYLMRAPYGSINSHHHELLRQREYLHVRWDIDSRDWALEGQESQIINNVDRSVNYGGIVLMHEHKWTTNLQPQLIHTVVDDGAEIVGISEFLTKGQKEWLCEQYECDKEMNDENSLFYKMCTYNLQCEYKEMEMKQEMDKQEILKTYLDGYEQSTIARFGDRKQIHVSAVNDVKGNDGMEINLMFLINLMIFGVVLVAIYFGYKYQKTFSRKKLGQFAKWNV